MSSQPSVQPANFFLSLPMVWIILLGVLAARLLAIGTSPLGPGVDEAQYWLWGQTPQFGYYSKPPLIAWILSVTSQIFDDKILALRVAAPICHLLTALLLWRTGRLLFNETAGRFSALLWLSLPAVGLGSFVMTTDTPMLLFWSAGLYCFVRADRTLKPAWAWIILSGICIGLSALAKYAGLYFVICVFFWLLASRNRPTSERIKWLIVFCAFALVTSLPTWLWNFSNGFMTIVHLGENANFHNRQLSFEGVRDFWLAQFAVFGPLSLLLLFFTLMGLGHRRTHKKLHFFVWPVLVIITIQAFLKEANANWAIAAYPAAALLVGQICTSTGKKLTARFGQIALLVNLFVCAGFALASAVGSLGPFAPASDPLRHLRGWEDVAQTTLEVTGDTGARTVVAYDRESAALLHWHLYESGLSVVLARLGEGEGNHYHRTYPLTLASPQPLLALTETEFSPSHLPVQVVWSGPIAFSEIKISRDDYRRIWFWLSD